MLDVFGPGGRAGTRRAFLRAGTLALAGRSLADRLRLQARAAAAGDTAAILIYLGGGPSHIDMYDLKPDAPAEYRGEFREIATNVDGIRICEHLPLQAKVMDRLAIVRSVSHGNSAHGMATHGLLTGYFPQVDSVENFNPSCGSVVAHRRGRGSSGLPAYACLPSPPASAGAAYLGAACNPFATGGDPNDPEFQVRNLRLTPRVDLGRLRGRRDLLGALDTFRRDADARGDAEGYDQFYRDAFEVVTGEAARRAFDIHAEDPRLRDRYGRHTLGQCCLLARRLVEAGVSFVTINSGLGWDTHADNFSTLKSTNLPQLDEALAALVRDLHDRGLGGRVLVACYGEFGRTPRVNGTAGRDHWPGAMSVLFAGGGLKTGQVVGATDAKGEAPKSRALGPQDVLATIYHALGVDHRREFLDGGGRPIAILNEGKPIEELF